MTVEGNPSQEQGHLFLNSQPSTRGHERRDANHSLWYQYRNFVRNNVVSLSVVEDILNQILFWTPPPPTQNSTHDDHGQWREILHGLLSLHHMATDLAAYHEEFDDDKFRLPELFGTTVEIESQQLRRARQQQQQMHVIVSPTTLRIAITVVHNLLPTILQLVRRRNQRPRVRLWLETMKFALRLALIGSYWFQLHDRNEWESCGLVMRGGVTSFTSTPKHGAVVGTTIQQERARRNREDYVGRRTGRRTEVKDVVSAETRARPKSIWPLLLGELLHVYRPVHWAAVEASRAPTIMDWARILGIDVLSLVLLEPYTKVALNSQELKRRKLKIFLYLLRSPIFEKYTGPAATRVFRGAGRIPVVGSLLEAYFWEWVLYWKHPYASELD